MGKQKVVLAFSGGLDTSFCVKYLSEDKGYDVYTAIANTGGFSKEELANIEKRALALGAVKHATLDIEQEYYEKSIKYMIYGDILRNGTYPISVSSERIFQAIAIIEYAKSVGADCVAHGSTGAGNDQVRFDLTFQVLAPEIEIITPTPGTVWISMVHPAVIAARYPVSTTICCPGASSYSLMCPSNSRKTVPFPDRRCMINPSPPKRPPAMRFWKKTDISTPAVDARKALFWAIISCPGAISNARISPGKLDANAISPVPPCAV